MKKIITILLVSVVLIAVLPTSLLLFVGMMPSVAAFFIDKTRQQLKAMTVGCLNFAACFPYWLTLVSSGHTMDLAWEILSPTSMSLMYTGALAGYTVEWGVSLVVSVAMVQKGKGKLRSVRKQKEKTIERWGSEVTGEYRLDEYGFPVLEEEEDV